MSHSSCFIEPQVQMVWDRYGKHLEIQLPGAHHHRTITALRLRRRTGGHGDLSLGKLGWHKYLWAIQPRTWNMIWFRSMQKFDLSPWGVPSAIWSTMASTTPKRQWWWDSNAIKIPHQSRFGIKPVEFPQPDRNELYYDFNTLMKPAAPKAIAVFG